MLKREDGFTLVELIAVLIILGIIATVVFTKFISFEGSATQNVIDLAIEELNVREKLTWSSVKLKGDVHGDAIDSAVIEAIDWNIGNGTDVNAENGTINIRGHLADVVRTKATNSTPAKWSRQ